MKTQSKGPGHPSSQHAPEALDEKLTHLTEGVAQTASRFRVPILVALVAIVAVIAISGLISFLSVQQEGAWSEDIYLLFQKEPAQIRIDGAVLARDLEGTRIEPAFISQYARWLFEQNEPGDRENAVSVLTAAMDRHEGDMLIDLAHDELDQILQVSAGFELPPIPEPEPVPDPTAGAISPFPTAGDSVTPPAGTSTEDGTPEGDGTPEENTETPAENSGTPAENSSDDAPGSPGVGDVDGSGSSSPSTPPPVAGDGGL